MYQFLQCGYIFSLFLLCLAPSNVNIKGDFTVLEGNEINLTCTYTAGVPNTTDVTFKVNDQEFSVS